MAKWLVWPEMAPSQPLSLARRLWRPVLAVMAYAGVVLWIDLKITGPALEIPTTLDALLGGVLAMLLVFRTNAANDRWWEGRKLWGQLVNDSRNLAIKVRSLPGIDREEARRLGRLLVNFALALKEHLRDGVRPEDLPIYQKEYPTARPQHVPLHIATLVREQIVRWRQQGAIDRIDDLILDPHVRALMDVCGACERIKKTPLAPSYIALFRRLISLYLLALPWGLIDSLHFWTVPISGLIAYFTLGMELEAEDVEEPFGRSPEDLRLDDICRTVEASITEIFQDETAAAVPGAEPGCPNPSPASA
jgi:ion channel-forming bestrophin family protein